MMRPFLSETTAVYGLFGCSWSYTPWRTLRCPVSLFWFDWCRCCELLLLRPPLVYGVFGCSLSSAPWRTCQYAVCPVWPSCAIIGSKDIFRPHTKAFACWRCGFLIPWTAGVFFSGCRWKRTSWRASWYAGCPWGRHGCSWATMRVYFAREKNELTINTYATSNRFFLFFTYPHACMRAQQPSHFVFQNV